MDVITRKQYEELKKCKMHPSLSKRVLENIMRVKTIVLTSEGGNYYVRCVELGKLCESEIRGIMISSSSDFVRLGL